MRVVALNLASGRGPEGSVLSADALGSALRGLLDGPGGDGAGGAPDVVALSEVDDGQPRSGGVDQAAVAAQALGAGEWRSAPTLAGTPGRRRDWTSLAGSLRGPTSGAPAGPGPGPGPGPRYGVALLVRAEVVSWHALDLGTGHGRLPLPVTDPVSGRPGLLLFPDEPRTAVAAVLADGTVVAGTHLSFSPPTALRQLRRTVGWLRGLAPRRPDGAAGRVLLAGDLNLPAPLVRLAAGAPSLVRAPTFPAPAPRLQLDHVVSLGAPVAATGAARRLGVGDHRALVVDVETPQG